MSLILDALRKSEAERRRGEAPGLFSTLPTPGARPTRKSPPWSWLALLTIVIAALLAWNFWPSPSVQTVVVAVQPPPAPVVSPPASPAPEAIAEPVKIAPAEKPRDEPKPIAVEALPLPPKAPAIDTPPKPDAPKPELPPLEALPTLAVLPTAERATLPPLKLSMHVWSEAPNARLAIIDGQRVLEGSAIGDAVVAEIRPDGVVLEVHGHRYLLPRP